MHIRMHFLRKSAPRPCLCLPSTPPHCLRAAVAHEEEALVHMPKYIPDTFRAMLQATNDRRMNAAQTSDLLINVCMQQDDIKQNHIVEIAVFLEDRYVLSVCDVSVIELSSCSPPCLPSYMPYTSKYVVFSLSRFLSFVCFFAISEQSMGVSGLPMSDASLSSGDERAWQAVGNRLARGR